MSFESSISLSPISHSPENAIIELLKKNSSGIPVTEILNQLHKFGYKPTKLKEALQKLNYSNQITKNSHATDKRSKIITLVENSTKPFRYTSRVDTILVSPTSIIMREMSRVEFYHDDYYNTCSKTAYKKFSEQWLTKLIINKTEIDTKKIKFIVNNENEKKYQIPLSKGRHNIYQVIKHPYENSCSINFIHDVPKMILGIKFRDIISYKAYTQFRGTVRRLIDNTQYFFNLHNIKKGDMFILYIEKIEPAVVNCDYSLEIPLSMKKKRTERGIMIPCLSGIISQPIEQPTEKTF